ncbi:unnamed protein product, partial [marine sediment metagenome]
MDKSDAINIARVYAGLINNTFNPQQVILFGSYAKGT